MPTLLNENGFKFFFYANEHMPRHIHVVHAKGHAKIGLGTLHVVRSNMPSADLKRAMLIVRAHNDTFERKWDEFFNR